MKKFRNVLSWHVKRDIKKLLLMTKLTVFLSLFFVIQLSANVYSQTKLTVDSKNKTVKEVLLDIEDQSEFRFFYNEQFSDLNRYVKFDIDNESIDKVMDKLFVSSNFTYKIMENNLIIITPDENLQEITVKGRVTSSSGDPIPGVSIVVKGTTLGTVSDNDGNYTIDIKVEDKILIFSFVGMLTQEIAINGRSTIEVTLEQDIVGVDEVVVIGYGTQKRVNLTGSVETINDEKINWKQVGQTSMALQGIAPGVTVTQNSGQPGKDGGVIRIRGIGTLGTAGQNPLVLMDGVETSLNSIDPADIESISVLKDAASAAIYGSRAANGVILVTTKRAKDKKLSVSYRGYTGWQSPTDMPKITSGLDHLLLTNEAQTNLGNNPTFSQDYIDAYIQNSPSDLYPDTDWQALTMTTNGFMQNHSFDVSGGNEIVMIRASFNALEQNGLIPNTGYNRYSLRINSDITVSEKLNFAIDITGRDERQYEPSRSMNTIFWYMTGRLPASYEGVLSDGRYGQGWIGYNPMAAANDGGLADNRTYAAILNFTGEWQPVDGLRLSLMYAPKFYSNYFKEFQRTINTYYGDGTLAYIFPDQSFLTQRSNRTKDDNFKALVNYEKSVEDHNFTALGGFEQIENYYEWFQARRENYPFEDYQVLDVGSEENQKANGSASEWALRSYFGRLNYNFKQKYLFEANIRYDGSSRFSEGNKFGVFPSFSAGWRISEESFLSSIEAIDNLKFRASWGQLGNQNIGNYPFASSVSLTQGYILNETAVPGASLTNLANPNISWETTEMLNFGVDVTFLQQFSLTAEYYIKNTRDILLNLPIPMTVGLNAPYQNAGEVKNTGWDFSLNYHNSKRDLKYDLTFLLSDVKNEIVDLKGTGPYIGSRTIRMEGEPMDALYGYETDGLFQTQAEVASHATQFGGQVAAGDIKYVDQNDDGIINPDDKVIIGSSIPRLTYGLSANASYKGFDVSMFVQGVGKADGYLDRQGVWAFYVGGTVLERHLDRWTPDNTDGTYPRLTFNYPNNEQTSDYWMLNAAYLRLKNLQIGYTIPPKVFDKTFIEHCRFFASGQNLLTIANFLDGFDVETPMGSVGYYPVVKIYSIGVEVKF